MSRIVGTALLVVAIAGCHEATPPTSPRLSALDVGSPPVPYEVIDLGNVSGMTGARAVAMNDRGQIVGFSSNQRGVTHPFLWQDGVLRRQLFLQHIDDAADQSYVEALPAPGAFDVRIHSGKWRRHGNLVCGRHSFYRLPGYSSSTSIFRFE